MKPKNPSDPLSPKPSGAGLRAPAADRQKSMATHSSIKLQAYRVSKDGQPVGVLGTGPGPFLSARRAAGRPVVFSHARFHSSNVQWEQELLTSLRGAESLDALVATLGNAGYTLEKVPFAEHFAPDDIGGASPELDEQLDRDLRDLGRR